METQDRILRGHQVYGPGGRTGIRKTKWHNDVREGVMPSSIELGPNSVGWRSSQIDLVVQYGVHWADGFANERLADDVKEEIAGTEMAKKGAELYALASVDHNQQREALAGIKAGRFKNAREAIRAILGLSVVAA